MKKYLYLLAVLLLIPAIYVYATDGVSTVEHPAKVNSVVTPDKVCSVSGLAGAADYSDIVFWLNFVKLYEIIFRLILFYKPNCIS